MFNALSVWLFDSSGLTPHGFCLLWQPGLIWTYALSDAGIGLAYFSIPVALGVIARRRKDLAFRPFLLAVRRFHFSVRRNPLPRRGDAVVAGVRRPGSRQGDDRGGVDLHRRRAMEADAGRARASLAFAVPRDQCGAAGDRGKALSGAEDGGRRSADRRDCARLQQHDPGSRRQPDVDRAPDRERSARRHRPVRRADASRAEQHSGPDKPSAGVLAPASFAAEADRARWLHRRHEGVPAAHPRPRDSTDAGPRRRQVGRGLRRQPARSGPAQSRHQRARRDAGRGTADDLGVGPQADGGGPCRPGAGRPRRLCGNQGDGHRNWHDAGRPRPGFRTVLHDKADGQRNRSRPVAGLWVRPAVRRFLPHREQAGRRDFGVLLSAEPSESARRGGFRFESSPGRRRRPRAARCSSWRTRTR